jgi:RNA polymerase sigma-70 factor (ECF subfamily)
MGLALFFDVPPSRGRDDDGGGCVFGARPTAAPRTETPALPFDHPDHAAVEALRAGDVGAFEALYTAHATSVYEFVQGYVSADVADDVVQDVFLTLWRRRASVAIHRSIRAYLFGAARLRALQYRRNAKTHETIHTRIEPGSLAVAPDAVEVAEVRAAVTHALMTLPGRTRELLALRWVYGLSYAEAATVLGVSPDAAKKLGRRAERTLAPLLEQFRT